MPSPASTPNLWLAISVRAKSAKSSFKENMEQASAAMGVSHQLSLLVVSNQRQTSDFSSSIVHGCVQGFGVFCLSRHLLILFQPCPVAAAAQPILHSVGGMRARPVCSNDAGAGLCRQAQAGISWRACRSSVQEARAQLPQILRHWHGRVTCCCVSKS